MTARAARQARDTYDVEMPWALEDEGRQLYISGRVTLGGRWPVVEDLRVVDQRTSEDLDLPDWAKDGAEAALIDEAARLWSAP